MNFNVEVRKKQLQSLDQCITSFKDKVDSILGYLGWSAKKVLENDDRTLCPINTGHTIQLESVVPHVERCRLTSSGYSLTETFLSEPSSDSKSSICLNNHEKIEVLNKIRSVNPRFVAAWNGYDPDPRTSDRVFSTYSADERLALYDHAVAHTQGPPVLNEFDINLPEKNKEDKTLTHEEELQKERDAKRRRVKYRSVHTGRNKSYTEVMKEVISNQMEQFIEYLQTTRAIVSQEQIAEINNAIEAIDDSASYINYDQYMPCDISGFACPNDSSYDEVNNESRPSSSIGRHSPHSGKSHEHSRHSSRSRSDKTYHRYRREDDRKRKRSQERHDHRDTRTHSHSDYERERFHAYKDSVRDSLSLRQNERDKNCAYPERERYRRDARPGYEKAKRHGHPGHEKDRRYSYSKTERDWRNMHGEHDSNMSFPHKHERKRTPPSHRNGDDRHNQTHRYRPEKRH